MTTLTISIRDDSGRAYAVQVELEAVTQAKDPVTALVGLFGMVEHDFNRGDKPEMIDFYGNYEV